MNKLSNSLSEFIRRRVAESISGIGGARMECRFVFNGPPLLLLEPVFEKLVAAGGIEVQMGVGGGTYRLPVLLQIPAELLKTPNPRIGESGRCDKDHLLDVRNSPTSASFVALVPPSQSNAASITTSSDEFGIKAAVNSRGVTFDQWWDDDFVQQLLSQALRHAGFVDDLEDATKLVDHAASSMFDYDQNEDTQTSTWLLLSRIFSVADFGEKKQRGVALSLACGVPPLDDGSISAKLQIGTLDRIADELSDGFKTSIERMKVNGTATDKEALDAFLLHILSSCKVPSSFDRTVEAFYVADRSAEVIADAPAWWKHLTVERWAELLSDEPNADADDMVITCVNPLIPVLKGMPAIVLDNIELELRLDSGADSPPVVATLSGGGWKRAPLTCTLSAPQKQTDFFVGAKLKSATSYKLESLGRKTVSTKVISLAGWDPGILLTSRVATKLSIPKKPAGKNPKVALESSIVLPSPGRYEMLVFLAPGVELIDVEQENASETAQPQSIDTRTIRKQEHQFELEADGNCQLLLMYRVGINSPILRFQIHVSCDEVKEEGCRSEFERLIRLNRMHLDKSGKKAIVQLDRTTRLAALQTWILDDHDVANSFRPIVLSEDYGSYWATPNWQLPHGPQFSKAKFLQDPRPKIELFLPPNGYTEMRSRIARKIRDCDDGVGLTEAAPLGKWTNDDPEFRGDVETYLRLYLDWMSSSREIASWADVIAVCPSVDGGTTLSSQPEAIVLSPLHPLRLAWHCLAQQVLVNEVENQGGLPCPAASILDADCIPDIFTLPIQSDAGIGGVEWIEFLSVESNSDYWGVLWNGSKLGNIPERSRKAPFDQAFGLVIGGLASGFSPAQVSRALEDVSFLLGAKSRISVAVTSAGGATDAFNEGLIGWCVETYSEDFANERSGQVGPRSLNVYDKRPASSRPDQATIANLVEDTAGRVSWYDRLADDITPDLGIVAQLDSAEPRTSMVAQGSPLSYGGLIRHRIRRQLNNTLLSESRQGMQTERSDDPLANLVSSGILALEDPIGGRKGLVFSPNVNAVTQMIEEHRAGFVAVSSSAVDPACFLGGWVEGTYLWDYDLPSYSSRAGDTSGYYLLSQVREADKEAIARILKKLPNGTQFGPDRIQALLHEVARRGIPTVRGLSGDDTGATGDLGLFLAVRLLQDEFRHDHTNGGSLLPVLAGTQDDLTFAVIIPVDPFRGYLADVARSIVKDRKELSLSRPDLLVFGVRIKDGNVSVRITPVEVKYRQDATFNTVDSIEALEQAKSLSRLLSKLLERSKTSIAWRLTFQHLLLSMLGFGMRVYSQQQSVALNAGRWAGFHEQVSAALLLSKPPLEIDSNGRLIVIDGSTYSGPRDHDADGFSETIVISSKDASQMVGDSSEAFYEVVRAAVADWGLMPVSSSSSTNVLFEPENSHANAPAQDEKPLVESRPTLNVVQSDSPSAEESTLGNQENEPDDIAAGVASKGVIVELGTSIDGFTERNIRLNISDTRLNHMNTGVVGDLGTGKTQLLKSLIFQISKSKAQNRGVQPRILIFDYKRDYSATDFVESIGAKVVKPFRLPLNLFDTSMISDSSVPWMDRYKFFSDVLDKIFSGIGPVQRSNLKSAVRAAYESARHVGRQPTIYDIHREYGALLNGRSDAPMSIIDDLIDMQIFEEDASRTLPFDQFLDGVVVVSLDALGQDDRTKNMVVAIMLNMFYENMLRLPKRPFLGTSPQLRVIDSYLLVDEADNIMRYDFDVLRKLLLQGREFGVGVILASQYLKHFKTAATDYREPLLTWFIHKVPNTSPAEIGGLGISSELSETAERIKVLPNHQCLFKTHGDQVEFMKGIPFFELIKSVG